MPAGTHTIDVDLGFLASGLYLYEIRAGDFVDTKAMTLVK